ncbi:MAG: DNA replication/repair protein RecF [Rhodobacteraceae bacterium]|nr:DNA replication/repair protein RecF [Paracoccaceae bacterium]
MSACYIASLSLSHFRSHRSAKLRFDGRPVAIYGPNGAGKTNLIEAVSLLSPGRGLRRAQADALARRPEGVGWRIKAELSDTTEIEIRAAPGEPRRVKINDKAQPQLALARHLRMLWLVPAMDRLWIEGAEGRRRFIDRAAMSFDPKHGEAVLGYEKAMRERNRLLKDMVRDAHWYIALERQMAQMGARVHTGRQVAINALMAAQQDAQTAFPTAELRQTYPEVGLEGEEGLLAALSEHRRRDMAAGRSLTGPHRADISAFWQAKDIEAKDCSTGEQKALLISLVLANGRALAQSGESPPILLLDEVAAHLDAERRGALYDEVCALKAQAFLTGTGAELFAELGDRAQVVEMSEGGSQAKEGLAND